MLVAVLLKSFLQAAGAIEKMLEMIFGRKRLERLTERIEQRQAKVETVAEPRLKDRPE